MATATALDTGPRIRWTRSDSTSFLTLVSPTSAFPSESSTISRTPSTRDLAAHFVFPVESDALVYLRAVDRERTRHGIEQADFDRLALRLRHEGGARH